MKTIFNNVRVGSSQKPQLSQLYQLNGGRTPKNELTFALKTQLKTQLKLNFLNSKFKKWRQYAKKKKNFAQVEIGVRVIK